MTQIKKYLFLLSNQNMKHDVHVSELVGKIEIDGNFK